LFSAPKIYAESDPTSDVEEEVTHMRKPEMKAVSGRTTLKNTSWDWLAGLASLLLITVLAYRDLIRDSTLRL
jgi:hypothetical protein